MVSVAGDVKKEVKVVWPSANVGYCKDHIKDRDCDKDSVNPSAGPDAVKIAFGK